MSVETRSFAALCRGCRGILGWSQGQLAEKTSMAVTSIARIESGLINPRHDTVIGIIRAFESSGLEINHYDIKGGFSLTVKRDLFKD
jgi:predicted transcriptional regulator